MRRVEREKKTIEAHRSFDYNTTGIIKNVSKRRVQQNKKKIIKNDRREPHSLSKDK